MNAPLLGAATALVLGWTRLYTWRMPTDVRAARLAEIESDLWESTQDPVTRGDLHPAAHVLLRLLVGVPDDVRWRVAQAPAVRGSLRVFALTATMAVLLGALFVLDVMRAAQLPVPPSAFHFVAAPAPPPPAPPCRPPDLTSHCTP
ncbi:MAG TPA: hypothetical protein VI485_21360 [Vicinamibacterales bacterium]|nr:hypothetical protein [Vicinamibacterales bacterium]